MCCVFVNRFRPGFSGSEILSRCLEHILDKNSIANLRCAHQHMGHSADELSVLDDRAAAHALDDAPGGFQQRLVRHLQQQIPPIGAVGGIDLENLHRIITGRKAADSGANAGLPRVNLVGAANGDWLPQPALAGFSKHPLGRVFQQLTAALLAVTASLELTGMAAFALGDGLHLGGISRPLRHVQQHAAAPVDPVA